MGRELGGGGKGGGGEVWTLDSKKLKVQKCNGLTSLTAYLDQKINIPKSESAHKYIQ